MNTKSWTHLLCFIIDDKDNKQQWQRRWWQKQQNIIKGKKEKKKKTTTAPGPEPTAAEAATSQMKTIETKATTKETCTSDHSEDNSIFDKLRKTKSGIYLLCLVNNRSAKCWCLVSCYQQQKSWTHLLCFVINNDDNNNNGKRKGREQQQQQQEQQRKQQQQ